MAEFEDALRGTFEQFLGVMPHIEHKTDDKGRLVGSLWVLRPDEIMPECRHLLNRLLASFQHLVGKLSLLFCG
jgi:hypothetical protein